MRVAYVCMDRGIPVFGCKGASVHVQGITRALLRAGHDVSLFATRLGDAPPEWASSLHLVPLTLPDAVAEGASPAWLAAANAALRAALTAAGPFDLVYERYSLWSHGAMEWADAAGVPGVLEVNAPLIDEQATHRGLEDRSGAEQVACRAFRAASTLVAVSREVAAWVNRNPCTRRPAVVEPNGVEPDRFQVQRPAPGAPFTIGFVGTLKPWHGLDVLADAYALVRRVEPTTRLLIVGDGPERSGLQRRLAGHDVLDGAHFTGAIAPDAVGPWLNRMHVAVAPYPASGPFYFSPLKIVEYQAAGVPVVASAIGQIPQLVRHRETGWLVPAGDSRAIAEACLAIRADSSQAATMANVARARTLAERSWDAVAARILDHALHAPRESISSRHRDARVQI